MRRATGLLLRAQGAVTPRVLVCDGDSITAGDEFNTTQTNYPAVVRKLLPSPWGVVNLGVDGITFATIAGGAGNQQYIQAAHNNGRKAIVSCAAGTNDIGLASSPSAASLFATATTYWANARARGSDYNIGWTLLARGAGVASQGLVMTAVQSYAGMMRQAVAAKTIAVDYLVDATADVTIGNPTNVTNTAIFADGVLHPTIFGAQVLANLLAAAVLSYQTRSYVSSVSPTSGSHSTPTLVTINGQGLAGATAVIIGGLQASIQSVSDSKVTALTAQAFGTVWPWPYLGDVSVLGPNGCGQLRNVWTWT